MTKTSIQIDNLVFLNKRNVQFPNDLQLFSLTMAYLIKDFSEKNNINKDVIMNSIVEHNHIVKICDDK